MPFSLKMPFNGGCFPDAALIPSQTDNSKNVDKLKECQ